MEHNGAQWVNSENQKKIKKNDDDDDASNELLEFIIFIL